MRIERDKGFEDEKEEQNISNLSTDSTLYVPIWTTLLWWTSALIGHGTIKADERNKSGFTKEGRKHRFRHEKKEDSVVPFKEEVSAMEENNSLWCAQILCAKSFPIKRKVCLSADIKCLRE